MLEKLGCDVTNIVFGSDGKQSRHLDLLECRRHWIKMISKTCTFAPWSSHPLDLICRCHGPVASIVRPATTRVSGDRPSGARPSVRRPFVSPLLSLSPPSPPLSKVTQISPSDPTSACRYFPWIRKVRQLWCGCRFVILLDLSLK